VANFSLATNEFAGTDAEGNRQERTEWHTIVVFGKQADFAKQYLRKGRLVFIEGRLQTREWEDRDGNRRRTTEVVASQVRLLDSRRTAEDASGAPPREESKPVAEVGLTDDDVPF
jgi:single-strand DNA-binding protein